jgi:large subunit ribosomal protein L23
LSELNNVYVFEVTGTTNKHSVAKAVAAQFDVTVTKVNMANLKGKTKRTIRRGGRAVAGRQSDVKKAYVTLKEGDSIAIFQAPDQETNEPKPDQLGKRGKK